MWAQQITAVEYFFDTDPGLGLASPISITPAADLIINETLPTALLAGGVHNLVIRAKDDNGKWSIVSHRLIYINSTAITSPTGPVDYVEYFFDNDPGPGLATALPVGAGTDIALNETLVTSTLEPGVHSLIIRARNNVGIYSILASKLVYINRISTATVASPIDYVEYFFDTDPGNGNALSLDLTPGTDITITDNLDVASLSTGVHQLVIRARNEKGEYSILSKRLLYINPVTNIPATSSINYVEYFFDTDPGKGTGTSLPVTTSADVTLNNNIDVTFLSPGVHSLVVRARNEANQWSIISKRLVVINNNQLVGSEEIVALEYFVDTNPGTGQGNALSFTGPASDSVVSNSNLYVLFQGGAEHDFVFRAKNARGFWSYPDTIRVNVIRSLASDSLILKVLYDSTKGANWTNRSNWFTGNISTWHGITIVNQEVRSVLLPNNNLDGPVPTNFGVLIHLEAVDFSTNKITSLPPLSHLPNLTSLNVSSNRLDFSSLEPNVGIPSFLYEPQATVGPASAITLAPANEAYELVITSPGNHNTYQWKRASIDVNDAVDSLFTIPSLTRTTMGTYVCEIRNSLVPNLVLLTNPQTVLATASISGDVLIEGTEVVTEGTIDLLRVTNSGAYDTTQNIAIHEDGSYSFQHVVLDDYVIVASPDTITYPRAIPTYSNSTIFWEEADTLRLNEHILNLRIHTESEPVEIPAGTGSLIGFLEEADGLGGRVKKNSRVGGSGVTARRAQGTGRGEEILYELIAYTVTDENGEFSMEGLPNGDYRLNMQYPGFPMDSASFLTFSIQASKPLEKEVRVEATVLNNKITVRQLVITEVEQAEGYKASVYPNPAHESIRLVFETTVPDRTIHLTNDSGILLKEQVANRLEETLAIQDLQTGIYLLLIKEKGSLQKVLRVMIY